MAMSLQVINGPVIEAGESLSDAIDCSAGQLVRITMPAAWTRAQLTFQVSSDGEFFNELYGIDGFAVTLKEVVPAAGVIIPGDIGRAIGFIRFRSGTEGNPDTQEERREFAVTLFTDQSIPVAVFDPVKGPPKRKPRPRPKKKLRRK